MSREGIEDLPGQPQDGSPLASPIQAVIDDLLREIANEDSGVVATYIPELGRADPGWFGISLVTADGKIYEAGDVQQEFTIQSISKPFAYGMALEDSGKTKVLEKIWLEPSGEPFNAISLRPLRGQPENPMINAGAIATTSLVEGQTATQKFRRIMDGLSRYAGRPLSMDKAVFHSECETGHRNRAIAYMLRNFNIIESDPLPSLEAYFMQCSISVTCRDLGIMAATLANAGVNPVTGQRAIVRENIESLLSVMGSCGMYDAAGEWIYHVGMPAKSGVSGGILAVLPGQIGIGVFSPRLDERGNSVRGIKICRELSRIFNLHMFNVPRASTSALRRVTHLGQAVSKRLRLASEMDVLKEHGRRIEVIEIQGAIVIFAATEVIIRKVMDRVDHLDGLILDLKHVQSIDFVTLRMLGRMIKMLVDAGKFVSLSRIMHLPGVGQHLRKRLPPEVRCFEDLDLALEHAENHLLALAGGRRVSSELVAIEDCELLEGMSAGDVALLKGLMSRKTYIEGETIVREGDAATELYFLLRGKASVWLKVHDAHIKRVATFTPGMTFGDMAFLDGRPRSADVTADSEVEVMSLGVDGFASLAREHPGIEAALLRNLSLALARRLRVTNFSLLEY